MGAFITVVPTMVDSWSTMSRAIKNTASRFGFKEMSNEARRSWKSAERPLCVDIDLEHSEVLEEAIEDSNSLVFEKKEVMVVFGKDREGHLKVQAHSVIHPTSQLREIGTRIAQRVLQQYIYEKLQKEMNSQNFQIVDETRDENGMIHLSVRRWTS